MWKPTFHRDQAAARNDERYASVARGYLRIIRVSTIISLNNGIKFGGAAVDSVRKPEMGYRCPISRRSDSTIWNTAGHTVALLACMIDEKRKSGLSVKG
jgi:hypothetical protein